MISLYLIRHGQAGRRDCYDTLSDLGREQARRLGRWIARQGFRFSAVFSGGLSRQLATADEAARACIEAGGVMPAVEVDARWNEFDLGGIYDALAPQIAAEDSGFRAAYQQMLRAIADPEAEVHRRWNDCDTAVVRAWIAGKYLYPGESWEGFEARVASCMDRIAALGPGESIAVFTSATPIGIWAAMSLGLGDGRAMKLAGVVYNSAITTIRVRSGELTLFSFNSVPHLDEPALRTFR